MVSRRAYHAEVRTFGRVSLVRQDKKPVIPAGPAAEELIWANIRRTRQLLNKGRAEMAGHRPFTIRLLDRADGEIQSAEHGCDAGDLPIGIPVCTKKQEAASLQYDLLPDEPERAAAL